MFKSSNNILFFVFFMISFNGQASIIYDADASSSFSLISSGGLIISAVSSPEGPSTITTGTGLASIDADLQSDPLLFTDTPLTQSSEVSGSASHAFGTSMSDSLNSFFVTLVNPTDMTLTAEFSFTYSWSVSLMQMPAEQATLEAGFASAFFHLSGFSPSGSETLAIDEGLGDGIVSMPDWLFNPVISFNFEELVTPFTLTGSTTITAYVTAPEFSTNRFSVITDASGAAAHISTPNAISIFIIALFTVITIHRKHT